jgi:hypothetical protein
MPISLDTLKAAIKPARTALVLGAGSSVPSGAPTGAQLAHKLWRKVANSEPQSDDLVETASILERRFSRRAVVDAVLEALNPLRPTGGLLGLPKFGWKQVFTTNFDRLIEMAYRANGITSSIIRSNFDFTNKEISTGTKILKIHGCITQDQSLGHKASMILTEADYETHLKYRQAIFSLLETSLLEGDALIIGQSLRDPHLHELVKRVLVAKQQGAPGEVYTLVYDRDDLRAPLLEDRGARIAFGGIDEFMHVLGADFREAEAAPAFSTTGVLPLSLVSTVYDVSAQAKASANVTRMFNGGPATYADIGASATFERARHSEAVEGLTAGNALLVILTGAAGVGKSTFARQILLSVLQRGALAWEHRSDFPFEQRPWIGLETQLRAAGASGVLLIDECTHYLRAVNTLIDHLAQIDKPALRVILTANSALWSPRIKSPNIYSKGVSIELSRLNDAEINSLLNLVQFNRDIAALVESNFKRETRSRQFEALRQKCSADMFVCLKNIFANQSLDMILLAEYDGLDEVFQEYYRYVAALEAVGTRVHRQLLIRMLKMMPTRVGAILDGLSGIVDEYEINKKDGIYGWSTRHLVIARRIAEYKFSGLEELKGLFDTIIDNINPAVPIELQSIRGICDSDFGIGRLGESRVKQALYRRLIEIAPAERIPWHRLIRELLSEGSLDDTEYVIRNAEEAVGSDAPINRYKVRLVVVRAQKTVGISEGDRTALLRKAYELAMNNIGQFKWDKFSFVTLCDVAVQLVQRGQSQYYLDEAIEKMKEASDRILDPDMIKRARHFEEIRTRLR